MDNIKERIEIVKPNQFKKFFNYFAIAAIIIWAIRFAGFFAVTDNSFFSSVIVQLPKKMSQIFGPMFYEPKVQEYFVKIIPDFRLTIQMAITASFTGAIIALPIAVLAANNFLKSRTLNTSTRIFLNIIRTIPALFYAKVFVSIFGLGSFPGFIALTIFSFGLISKLLYESIESIDEGQVEALTSLGANKFEIFRYAILPQILPQYVSYALYSFEINIRAALILGYVGAGGIGEKLVRNLNNSYINHGYGKTGVIIVSTFVVVLLIDQLSSRLRRRLV